MDAIRFDALTKAWFAETSRRRTLAGLLAGALGALGLAVGEDADAAKSGKCKKKCGECQFCKKGTCKRRKTGKKRCKKGKCKPEKRGTPCGAKETCFCIQTIEGDPFCTGDEVPDCEDENCANSGDCPSSQRCIRCGSTDKTACIHRCIGG